MMIEARSLDYTYSGAAQAAIRDLTFAVQPGEIFGFLGPSGAGKSTTQRLLTGLLSDYTGTVTVLGRDLRHWGADYYERIGVSFEAPNHFSKLTARENLAYFAALYSRPTVTPERLLEMVGLGGDAELPVARFSKGMKNRLTVARALLHSPDLLFLDEPTAGLDPANARRIAGLIRQQQQTGKTIFLATHDMMVAETLCDRVAFIVEGQIRLIAAPQALKLQYGRATVRVDYTSNGRSQSQEFPLDGLGHNEAFLTVLREQAVKTIHTQEATLDDIFIRVTGRELRP